jgi:hypothetical protein
MRTLTLLLWGAGRGACPRQCTPPDRLTFRWHQQLCHNPGQCCFQCQSHGSGSISLAAARCPAVLQDRGLTTHRTIRLLVGEGGGGTTGMDVPDVQSEHSTWSARQSHQLLRFQPRWRPRLWELLSRSGRRGQMAPCRGGRRCGEPHHRDLQERPTAQHERLWRDHYPSTRDSTLAAGYEGLCQLSAGGPEPAPGSV